MIMRPAVSVSQSVTRVVRLLEAFDAQRRPLTSHEIGQALDAPRSSVAALLRALVDLSILSFDRRTTTYAPTARLARITAWADATDALDPALVDLVREIQNVTAETVTLAIPNDTFAELVLVERGKLAISFIAEPGQRIPLWGSAIGLAYLMTLKDAAISAAFDRARRRGGEFAPPEGMEDPTPLVQQMRSQGYAVAYGAVFSDAAALSAPTPQTLGGRTIILSVAGPTSRIQQKEALIAGFVRASLLQLQPPAS
jgi:DNA-binding IclR family transcriptional regulator